MCLEQLVPKCLQSTTVVGEEKGGNEGKRELNPRWRQAAVQQTAGVWVVVNHPEMSLFPQLNEA